MKTTILICGFFCTGLFVGGQTVADEVSTVYRVIRLFATLAQEEQRNFAPEGDVNVYTFKEVALHYSGYSERELLIMLLSQEEPKSLSEFSLALLYHNAAKENRLPAIQEILDELVPGKNENIDILCEMLKKYPGLDFERASSKISFLSPLSLRDLGKVIDALLCIYQGQYENLGNQYITGGYYQLVYERMDLLLDQQRVEVRDILHQRLMGYRPGIVTASAFMLALYGDDSSIPFLEAALRKYQNDINYQTLVSVALETLRGRSLSNKAGVKS